MLHAFPPDHLDDSMQNDLCIKQERMVFQVIFVKIDFNRYRYIVPSVDLCPAGQTRLQTIDAALRPESNQVVLIEQRWAWADETHLTTENRVQLWKLIHTCCAEELAEWNQIFVRVMQEMGRLCRGIDLHRPELGHTK